MTYNENEDFLVGLGLVGVRLRLLTYMICTYMYITNYETLQEYWQYTTGRLMTYWSCTGWNCEHTRVLRWWHNELHHWSCGWWCKTKIHCITCRIPITLERIYKHSFSLMTITTIMLQYNIVCRSTSCIIIIMSAIVTWHSNGASQLNFTVLIVHIKLMYILSLYHWLLSRPVGRNEYMY